MKPANLTEMERLAEARFLNEFEKLRPIIEAEARIRRQMVQLDEQTAEIRTSSPHMFDYRAFGADVAWHAWESRTRRVLNLELARLRAQKLVAMENLRLAHGRRQAAAKLLSQFRNQSARQRERVQLEQLCLSECLGPAR
ncbi:hypothetical protein AVO45_08300 [Ruegeria marisrubri]|uniref:Flagellar FliJ protein n=1 Tax=Ruegeria marisrubri TaxID=1685379 RepID=A0A0X3TQG9_9RHOB|nr:hypothetical protein [Ruegeria marisrubri]KUJ77963.1 hypothetical protein AVO45_08300 [Ruegeria marisrubri]